MLIGGAIIALGHFALAVPSSEGFIIGLSLVAIGTGLFKPNISALVGSLYGHNDPRRDAGFSIFYMGINIGAFIAPLITGFLAQSAWFKAFLAANGFDPAQSWHWGFGAAGVGMLIGLIMGPLFETYFLRSMRIGQGDLTILFSSWLGNAIWLMALAALFLPFIRARRKSGVLAQAVQAGHES